MFLTFRRLSAVRKLKEQNARCLTKQGGQTDESSGAEFFQDSFEMVQVYGLLSKGSSTNSETTMTTMALWHGVWLVFGIIWNHSTFGSSLSTTPLRTWSHRKGLLQNIPGVAGAPVDRQHRMGGMMLLERLVI